MSDDLAIGSARKVPPQLVFHLKVVPLYLERIRSLGVLFWFARVAKSMPPTRLVANAMRVAAGVHTLESHNSHMTHTLIRFLRVTHTLIVATPLHAHYTTRKFARS